jgi:hypothetical protein
MFKKILNIFKKEEEVKEQNDSQNYIVVTLNDKIMPIDRGEFYEDKVELFLSEYNLGEVAGGGTMQEKTGEIDYCDIEIKLHSEEVNKTQIQRIIEKFEEIGAPKGSTINIELLDEKIPFGKLEGLGLYLDGVNLSKNVYEECDINFVITEIHRLTETEHNVNRNWENESGIALYFYGESFDKMSSQIKDFIDTYPLCKNYELKKIA